MDIVFGRGNGFYAVIAAAIALCVVCPILIVYIGIGAAALMAYCSIVFCQYVEKVDESGKYDQIDYSG